ncbi:MAG: AAA family ATPase [Pseudomonadota bacterium]
MAPTTSITGFAVVMSAPLAQSIESVCRDLPQLAMHGEVAPAVETLSVARQHADRHDLLLLEVGDIGPETLRALQSLLETRGDERLTLVTTPDLSLDDVRVLHRLGVFDVVPQPSSEADLRATLQSAVLRLQRLRRQARGLAPVVAFTRAKGGMGATTIATHAALSMAGVGRRKAQPRSVAFLDLDLQFGDAAINLDLTSPSAVIELLQHPERLDAAALRTAMIDRPDGLSMLAAPRQLLPLDAMDPDFVGNMIDLARDSFDVVVIDLPIAITNWTQAVFARVNELVMVTALSVSAIRRTRRLLELLTEGGEFPMHVSIALNRYTYQFGQRAVLRQSEMTLGRPFDFKISNDYALVARSQDQGTSVFELKPRSSLAQDCHQLADTCLSLARLQSEDDDPAQALAAE